ncbi:MAG: hypothetical protein JXB49_28535 [Bacteroidales bacterium]|nr:hypothetical protein [Bacteroidales bacterium]
MKNFDQIEKEFFEINEEDNSSIVKFYYDNETYFASTELNDKSIGHKNLWMLSMIINSADKQKEYRLANKIAKTTISDYKKYSLHNNYDLKSDTIYKSMIYNVAIDNFNKKRYYWATKYFGDSVNLDKDNFILVDFYNESKYRFIKNTSRFFGLIGLFFLIIKYFAILILDINKMSTIVFGYIGAVLLLGYGIIEMTIKKPSH